MKVVADHRGYDIVMTDLLVNRGADGLCEVYIVPGIRMFPSEPAITSIEDAKKLIDAELDSAEEIETLMTEEFVVKLKPRGGSLDVIVPAKAAKRLGLEAGDEVLVKIRRA